MTARIVAIATALALLLAGCDATPLPPAGAPGVPFDPSAIVNGTWVPGEYSMPTACPNLFAGPYGAHDYRSPSRVSACLLRAES
jgi:hypothetical protein